MSRAFFIYLHQMPYFLRDLHLTCVKALQGHRASPTPQSRTSSRGLGTMRGNNVSTSTNTDELQVSRAHQRALLCLSLSAGLSKGRRAICPGAKHTFVFPKLYGFPRLDRRRIKAFSQMCGDGHHTGHG